MSRTLLSLSLALSLASAAPAQQPTNPNPPTTATPLPPLPGAQNTGDPPAAPLMFLFAAAFTIIVLLILCMPTRKA